METRWTYTIIICGTYMKYATKPGMICGLSLLRVEVVSWLWNSDQHDVTASMLGHA